ncbi:MAG: ISAzo13 family transposase [Actinomycetota bacterium]|nr:ISAzo13 family transposase [Actinomycetota bacterium]
MGAVEETRRMLAAKFEAIFPHLDERQRRLLMGAEARSLGRGGIRMVARAAGVREATVSLGVDELDSGAEPLGRVRRQGGGRKRAADLDPGLLPALLALVEPQERGDPMSPLRWTTLSTCNLADELARQGHKASAGTVGALLRQEGFSLQGNAKTVEGRQHPDRDAQFGYIGEQAREHMEAGDPVVSVDAKKKELVGEFKNGGREWRPKGSPARVDAHDFPDRELGKAIPYGIYDLAADSGWVNVGTDHDTAAFAVESVRRWWNGAGRDGYPQARRLLITADAGGSNGYRTRAWKTELAALAAETGLEITVCHLPPGTSKWNKIEHRLFSHITMNWRGRPLASHEVIVNSIAATTTRAGLTVHAELDPGSYPTGTEISDEQMAAIPLARHRFHGDWNYTLRPQPVPAPGAAGPGGSAGEVPDRAALSHPALTGMSRRSLDDLIAGLAGSQETQREQSRHRRRGTERRRAAGAGPRPRLTDTDRVLATVLYLRKLCTQAVLAELLAVDRSRITEAVRETRPLIEERGHAITPSTARFPAPADLIAFLAIENSSESIARKPAC